jgi:hypothetical protein
LLLSRRAIFLLLTLAGCSSAPDEKGGAGGSGGTGGATSDSGPLVLKPVEYDQVTQTYRDLADGDTVRLERPPQGGQVIFIAAFVQNLDSTTMELKSTVRDLDTQMIVQQDTRTVVMEPVPGQSGWLEPDHRSISQVSNIALCPDYDSVDIVGHPYGIEIEATELYAQFSEGKTSLSAIPDCEESGATDQALCLCECSAGYTLGKCGGQTFDAGSGSDAGSDADAGSGD